MKNTPKSTRIFLLGAMMGGLASSSHAVTTSVLSAWPTVPLFQTAAPDDASSERDVKLNRNLTQTFRFSDSFTLDKITMLVGSSEDLTQGFNLLVYEVANVNAPTLVPEGTALLNVPISVLGLAIPTTTDWVPLEFDLEGAEEIDLPFRASPAGYAIQLLDSGAGTRPFKLRFANSGNVYTNGLFYSEGEPYRDDQKDAVIAVDGIPADTDTDGMPDFWEDANVGLDKNDPTDASEGANDGLFDNDGLTNLEEYQNGTDPNNPDSDADGIDDGPEVSGSLNPFANAPTSPADDDSDDDGILDGEEIVAGVDGFITNPNSTDTDSDTLPDAWEVENGLDPTDPAGNNGGIGDPDLDTLNNAAELALGTHPNDADTDADGYGDEVENGNGIWSSTAQTGTSPINPDSDGDQLLDGKENPALAAHNPPAQYKTNPNIFDSDGDLIPDGVETAHGTDPDDILDFPTDLGTYIQSVADLNGPGGGTISGTHDIGIVFGEDVLAYTDRTHQHNGVTIDGLPSELLGGDYVMLPNDARDTPTYSSTITLKADAAVYLLLDDRAAGQLAWMSDGLGLDFIDTGLDSGIDEFGTGVGPGDSINRIGSIYLAQDTANGNATVLVPGSYTFYDMPGTLNMYSIVAADPNDGTQIIAYGFNAGAFELTVSGLKTYKQYVLKRATSLLAGFASIGDPFTPTSDTETVSDPAPPEPTAFYRVEVE